MSSLLSQLSTMTTIVADTGDIEAITRFRPEDATTNPSLLLKAAQQPQYDALVNQALTWARQQSAEPAQQVIDAADKLSTLIGSEITGVIPGRVSTEVDARLSFDTQASIDKARKLIDLYQESGVPRRRVLIKLAATWEGIRAAEVLEREEINCNLTLLFSFAQARACAEAGVYLISPFVGRILDWYRTREGVEPAVPSEDPGVVSVTRIYNYFKQHGYSTIVMGASFRNPAEITELAGCDKLTISPQLLETLEQSEGVLERKLLPDQTRLTPPPHLNASEFHWQHHQDPMAVEKLAEGIRNFAVDQEQLEQLLYQRLKGE